MKVIYLIGDGFRPEEYFYSKEFIENSGIVVETAGIRKGTIPARDIPGQPKAAESGLNFDNVNLDNYSGIVIPGGSPGWTNLLKNDKVIQLIKDANDKKLLIASMCASPAVLAKAGILNGKTATIFPGMGEYLTKGGCTAKDADETFEKKTVVVKDGNIITANGPWASKAFGEAIVDYLKDFR